MNKYLFKQKLLLTGTITFIITKSIFNVVIALILKMMLDTAAYGNLEQLKIVILYFLAFAVLEPLICYLRDIFKAGYIQKSLISLKNDIFKKILNRDMRNFNEENTAQYISTLTNDITFIEQDYFESMFRIIGDIFSFILGTIALISINLYITLGIFIISILMLIIPMIFGKSLGNHKKKYSDDLGTFTTKIKDIFSGFEIIKSFNIENKTINEYEKTNYKVEISKKRFKVINSIADNVAGFIGGLMFLGSLLIGAYLTIKGEITIGSAMAATQLVNNVAMPMTSLSTYFNRIKSIKGIDNKVKKILSEENCKNSELEKISFTESIIFDKIKFSYDKNKNILNGFSMEFRKGKKYAVVGQSGCGKSTLIKLLLGYYNDYNGIIKMDGIDVRKIKSDSLYNLISIIHQDVFIFDDSIKNNISLFNNYADQDIERTIKLSDLNYVISSHGGIDENVGENGCHLSGGEKQRIAIARALIKNTPILILDEATSSLDNETSAIIENSLLNIDHLTCIVITHKLNADILRRYDKIVTIKNGSIEEIGTYDELMDNKGYFYSLYNVS